MSQTVQKPPEDAESQLALRGVRGVGITVALIAGAQVGLTMAHLPAWPCPFHALTGLPCPGCGLTRATVASLHGHLGEAVRWHVMGPLVPVVIVLGLALAVLPARWRVELLEWLVGIERRTRAGRVLLVLMMGYWILRLTGLFGLPSG